MPTGSVLSLEESSCCGSLAGGHVWRSTLACQRHNTEGQSGAKFKVLRIWQQASDISDVARRMFVDAAAPATASRGTFSLKLWESDGPRTVSIGNVTFP